MKETCTRVLFWETLIQYTYLHPKFKQNFHNLLQGVIEYFFYKMSIVCITSILKIAILQKYFIGRCFNIVISDKIISFIGQRISYEVVSKHT